MDQTSGEQVQFDEEVEEKPGKRLATRKEMRSLRDHFFTFPGWHHLNENCRMRIVGKLPLRERYQMMMCSERTCRLVNFVPLPVRSISIQDKFRPAFSKLKPDAKSVTVALSFTPVERCYELVFSQHNSSTLIEWCGQNYGSSMIADTNYYEKAVKFAIIWMFRADYKFEELTVELHRQPHLLRKSLAPLNIEKFERCTKLCIGARDEQSIKFWLNKVTDRLDALQITSFCQEERMFVMSRELLSGRHVTQCNKLYLQCHADLEDAEFAKLTANVVRLHSFSMTERGINEYLKNWAAGRGAENIQEVAIGMSPMLDAAKILAGLEDVTTQWNAKFVSGSNGCRAGAYYQIESQVKRFTSVTLCIFPSSVVIYGMGEGSFLTLLSIID